MISSQTENLLNLIGLTLGWVTFLILFFYGRKLPRKGDWLVGLFLVVMMTFQILSWRVQIEAAWSPLAWIMNWVDSAQSEKAMGPMLALIREPYQLALASLGTILFLILLVNQEVVHLGERAERSHSSLVLGFLGFILLAQSSNFWTVVLATSWILLAGWIAFSSHWEVEREADLATRFLREKGIALGLITVGGLMIQGSGLSLVWTKSLFVWVESYPSGTLVQLGGSLLLLGVLFLSGGFPWLGWTQMASRNSLVKRTLFGLILPSVASMVILVRLDPLFRGIGISNAFAWVSLLSSFLIASSAMAELKKESVFLLTINAVLGLGIAGGLFSSPWITASVMMGMQLVGLAVSIILTFSKVATDENESSRVRADSVASFSLFISGLLISGFFGFVAGPGILKSYLGMISKEGYVAVSFFALAHLLIAISGFRLGFGTRSTLESKTGFIKWMTALSPLYLIFLGSAWIWTGALTGEMVPGLMDQVGVSLFNQLFGQKSIQTDAHAAEAMGIHWGVFLFGIAISYWMTRGNPDRFEKWVQASPRFSGFISEQFGMDKLGRIVIQSLSRVGLFLQELFDEGLWQKSLPIAAKWTLRGLGLGFAHIDVSVRKGIDVTTTRSLDAAAWLSERVQSGKLQFYWYLTLFSGITLVVYLLMTRGPT